MAANLFGLPVDAGSLKPGIVSEYFQLVEGSQFDINMFMSRDNALAEYLDELGLGFSHGRPAGKFSSELLVTIKFDDRVLVYIRINLWCCYYFCGIEHVFFLVET